MSKLTPPSHYRCCLICGGMYPRWGDKCNAPGFLVRQDCREDNQGVPDDPRKVAEAMISAVERDDAPLRLLPGWDAIALWEGNQAALTAGLVRWRKIGEQAGFDGATIGPNWG